MGNYWLMLKVLLAFCIVPSLTAMVDDTAWIQEGKTEYQNNILREQACSIAKRERKVIYIDPKIVLITCKFLNEDHKAIYAFGYNTLPSSINLHEDFQRTAYELFNRLENKFYKTN